MSNHHGHHRSHQSRSRTHHSSSHYHSASSRSRTSSSNINSNNGGNGGGGNSNRTNSQRISENRDPANDWSEHRSSSGKVYYYNTRTGVSQWELPAELKPQRPTSPDSEISESSSIRQQHDKSPSSTTSSHNSAQSDSVHDDKPLLTPSLAQYYKPELLVGFNSSHVEETEQRASDHAKDALILSGKILKESVDLKIARAVVHYVEISLEAQEKKFAVMKNATDNYLT